MKKISSSEVKGKLRYLVDEYAGWRETRRILADPEHMDEIRRGLEEIERKSKLYTLDELFEEPSD